MRKYLVLVLMITFLFSNDDLKLKCSICGGVMIENTIGQIICLKGHRQPKLPLGKDDTELDIITMKSGEVYKGEIIFRNVFSVTITTLEGITIKLARRKIETVSTPVQKSEVTAVSTPVQKSEVTAVSTPVQKDEVESSVESDSLNKIPASTHIYNAGNKLNQSVDNAILGVIISIGGGYLMIDAAKNDKSTSGGAIIAFGGGIVSILGLFKIDDAGNDLKKASNQMKNKTND